MRVYPKPRIACRWGKAERILKRKDFRKAQSLGKRFSGKFLLFLLAKPCAPWARFGLTVGKSVGNAVVRNKLKRRLRDILRKRKTSLQNADVVVIAKSRAATASYQELLNDVESIWERIKQ